MKTRLTTKYYELNTNEINYRRFFKKFLVRERFIENMKKMNYKF